MSGTHSRAEERAIGRFIRCFACLFAAACCCGCLDMYVALSEVLLVLCCRCCVALASLTADMHLNGQSDSVRCQLD